MKKKVIIGIIVLLVLGFLIYFLSINRESPIDKNYYELYKELIDKTYPNMEGVNTNKLDYISLDFNGFNLGERELKIVEYTRKYNSIVYSYSKDKVKSDDELINKNGLITELRITNSNKYNNDFDIEVINYISEGYYSFKYHVTFKDNEFDIKYLSRSVN